MINTEQIEITINETCDLLDNVTDEIQKRVLEAKLFELVEQLNGNTIYLTVQ
jgi:Mor family transcriptional regulator